MQLFSLSIRMIVFYNAMDFSFLSHLCRYVILLFSLLFLLLMKLILLRLKKKVDISLHGYMDLSFFLFLGNKKKNPTGYTFTGFINPLSERVVKVQRLKIIHILLSCKYKGLLRIEKIVASSLYGLLQMTSSSVAGIGLGLLYLNCSGLDFHLDLQISVNWQSAWSYEWAGTGRWVGSICYDDTENTVFPT